LNIDYPLILVILVFGSGLIWLADALLAAGPRNRRRAALEATYPRWQEPESSDARLFAEAVRREARMPAVVDYARSFFPLLAVVFVLRSFLFEPFQIPSSSMAPTLEVGDYILVNKFTWGLRAPVLRSKFLDIGEPERGDVVVFYPPHMNDTYYIKRIVGLPGDRISYRNKQLTVNGSEVPQDWLTTIPDGRSRLKVGSEALGEDGHLLQVDLARPSRDFSVTVKPGHYFMMGDNRDNSSDSRVWGQVPERDIVGKAVAIWMHWESFFSVPSFGRAGAIN
jgi:signal peptidase I